MVRAGWIEPERPSSRKTNPALRNLRIFGLLRRGMTGESIALRSGTNSHQTAFPTTAPADIIGFK
jgi:hypothetical protein